MRDEPSVAPESVFQHSEVPAIHIQRELIRGALKDTMRRLGLPYDWLTCDVFLVSHARGEESLHIQITLMKWNETFLRYGQALQNQLLRGLDRVDLTTDHRQYIFSWRFAADCGCPFTVMPPPRIWLQPEETVKARNDSPSILDRRKSARPAKGAKRAAAEDSSSLTRHTPNDADYERTQLSPLG